MNSTNGDRQADDNGGGGDGGDNDDDDGNSNGQQQISSYGTSMSCTSTHNEHSEKN